MTFAYKQFCPVAMAAELLCRRWTIVLLRELVAGSTRFNDLRRGLPRMSPTLLAQRLRELEAAGVVERRPIASERGVHEYRMTACGEALGPIVEAMGFWGQKYVRTTQSLKNLDPSLLMWDMRRNLDPAPLPRGRTVIHFVYRDLPASRRNWWLVVEPGSEVELCSQDPGHDVDLEVTTDLRTMTAIWMGVTTVENEKSRMTIAGKRELGRSMQRWLGLSPFASQEKLVPA
jgi:DNA-binding HxlR family transcriptional regulator